MHRLHLRQRATATLPPCADREQSYDRELSSCPVHFRCSNSAAGGPGTDSLCRRTPCCRFLAAALPARMALVAIDAVVDVALNPRMIRVGLRLGVTVGALEHRIIVRVGVAGGAHV